jgi:hypothetical protein
VSLQRVRIKLRTAVVEMPNGATVDVHIDAGGFLEEWQQVTKA